MSTKAAEASRLNGVRSHGPLTQQGKDASKLNALKHGLRAGDVTSLPEFDRDAYEALHTDLVEDLAPVGRMEEELVARIASTTWRLRRAANIEAEILYVNLTGAGERAGEVLAVGTGFRLTPDLLLTVRRYETSLDRQMHRSLLQLRSLQEARTAASTAGRSVG